MDRGQGKREIERRLTAALVAIEGNREIERRSKAAWRETKEKSEIGRVERENGQGRSDGERREVRESRYGEKKR